MNILEAMISVAYNGIYLLIRLALFIPYLVGFIIRTKILDHNIYFPDDEVWETFFIGIIPLSIISLIIYFINK
ncbi:hypothetical protein JOD20_005320 [Herpetosiphon giganteus]|nr:hypothetical protein [Herpetosiphon giganteus]